MIVPDEVVIEALLKDARRFKSKWELHSNEPTRSKPNVIFLKRTLSNLVKTNQDRMRKPRIMDAEEQDRPISLNKQEKEKDSCESSNNKKSSRSRRDSSPRRKRSKKSGCSKSKYRSPESRSRSSKKRKRETSSSRGSPKR